MSQVQICTNCVMDTTDSKIVFDGHQKMEKDGGEIVDFDDTRTCGSNCNSAGRVLYFQEEWNK